MKRMISIGLLFVLLLTPSAQASESFMLDGTKYTLPIALADLLAQGWEINEPDEMLSPGSYTIADSLRRGHASCTVQIINLSMDDQAKRDCYIGQITFSEDMVESVALRDGITLDDTWSVVYDTLGTPTDLREEGNGQAQAVYEGNDFDKASFAFNQTDGRMTSVTLRSFTSPAPTHRNAPDPAGDAYIYEAPEALGQHLDNFHFRLNDVLYQLPMPLEVCIASGWLPRFDTSEQIASNSTWDHLQMVQQNGSTLLVGLLNPSASAMPASDCLVYTLTVTEDGQTDLQLPGGIALGLSEDELLPLLSSSNYTVEENGADETYTLFDGLARSIKLQISTEDERLHQVTLLKLPD